MLKGKKLSILGDSISTYQNISNNPEYHSTLFYNPYFYKLPFPMEKTYWHRLITTFGLTLCVNNSWSGGNLSGIDNENSGVNRVHNLSNNQGEDPDFIIVFMGINDLGRGVPLDVFSADYERVLSILKSKYPSSPVCCVNLPDRTPSFKKMTESFNAAIEKAVERSGENFFMADLFHSPLNNDFYYMNTVDGLHPDEDGMKYIAETIEATIRSQIQSE